jgi:crotonobetainyl-CoA:carnitine CoA-transferase CaiB-like acyl-CoA transferase
MIQAMSGLMSITGERDTLPGGGPHKVGVAVADILTGLYAGNAIQAALLHRELTGRGQYIDMALLDCQLAAMANQAMNYLVSGKPPGRLGNAHPNIVPYQVFASRDGFLIIAVGNDEQYRRFCRLLDREDLADEPDFQTNRERVRNREKLVGILEPLVKVKGSREWMQLLEEQNIPCGPIYTLDQTFSDPQTVSRRMRVEMDHALGGRVPLVGSPFKMSETPVEYRMPPPLLGEHTDEVLQDVLGLDQGAIGALRSERII